MISFCTTSALAQYSETISSGRPGQAITPTTVGKKIFQLETGIALGGYEGDILLHKGQSYTISTLFRFGLTETFEINTGWDLRSVRINMPDDSVFSFNSWNFSKLGEKYRNMLDSTINIGGLNLSTLGMRYNIIEGKGIVPAVGFQFTIKLNILNGDYNPDNIAPQFLLVTSQNLSERFSLTANLGADWSGNSASPTGIYVVNLAFSFFEKWGGFIENYGSFDDKTFDTKFDAGIAYLVNNNLQLDLLGGAGKNNDLFDYFISIGISWMKNISKKNNYRKLPLITFYLIRYIIYYRR
ncbi:MAG: transporter [Bacteroidota bacterium]